MGSAGNGLLLNAAEAAGFEILVTADKNMRYQQNLAERKIALIVLGNAQWPVLRQYIERVVAAIDAGTPGSLTEVEIPSGSYAALLAANTDCPSSTGSTNHPKIAVATSE